MDGQGVLKIKRIIAVDHEATGIYYAMLRMQRKIKQKDIASSMGIKQQYVSDLEHGRKPWTQKTADKYAKALLSLNN